MVYERSFGGGRMRDYREKDVMGFIGDTSKSVFPKPCRITVRMTSDKRGIPFEEVEDIIKITEKGE